VEPGVVFVMGCETLGLPPEILSRYPKSLVRIPITQEIRSLNLANASAIVLYDAMARLDWPGMS
jgi:tRNA (cytidine/uridine-2'-O-)-methyltransferase